MAQGCSFCQNVRKIVHERGHISGAGILICSECWAKRTTVWFVERVRVLSDLYTKLAADAEQLVK